jgi:hypothetical protein
MFRKMARLLKSRRTRSLEAQIAELRVAVAALLDEVGSKEGSHRGTAENATKIDAVLLHAAAAKVEADRLDGLYEAALARIAAVEGRLEAIEVSRRGGDRK